MTRRRTLAAVALSCLAGMAWGGAARLEGGGVAQGLAPFWVWGGLGVLALGLAWSVRDARSLAAVQGLWPLPLLILAAGAPWSGAGALTGRPLAALALAGGACLWLGVRARIPTWLFVPAAFALHLGVGATSAVRVGPQGDEPHYLVVADSLLRDHDLRLESDFAERRYLEFFDRPMEPHFRVRGREGAIYSLHAVGLSVLILPAYAYAGYPAVVGFMALLAALLCNEVRLLLRGVLPDLARADLLAVLFAVCPPLLPFGGLVFTEVPAALAVAVVLRLGLEPHGGAGRGLVLGSLMAGLPWLNARYAVLSVVLALFVAAGRPSPRLWRPGLLIGALSAVGIALYHSILYGFFDPRRVYGRHPEFDLSTLLEGAPGLLFDQEFGLFVYAPIFALTLPGLWSLRRTRPRLAGVAGLALGVMFVIAGSWHMWRGGFNPPARFLMPLWAPLALGAGWALRDAISARAGLLLGWTLFVAVSGGLRPELVHRDRDGTAPLFRVQSGADEWTRLLPSYVLGEADRLRLALLWGGLLLAAAVGRHRPARARGFAAGTLALAAVTALAARTTDAEQTARDHARVLGKPALGFPRLAFVTAAEATWTPGPTDYQPHRFPAGMALADRLELEPGRYRLAVTLGDRPPDARPPALHVAPERPGAGQVAEALEGPMLFYRFEIAGRTAWRLALVGGGPGRVGRVRLRKEHSTFPGPAGPIQRQEKEPS